MNFPNQGNKIRAGLIQQADPKIAYVLETFADLSIHLIFQHCSWSYISPAQWVRLQPALVMASFFIACPLAEDFWHGMLRGPRSARRDHLGRTTAHFDLVYMSATEHQMPHHEAQRVHLVLGQLSQVIKISLKDLEDCGPNGSNGKTSFAPGGPFCVGGKGVRSNIFLDLNLLHRIDTASSTELLRLWLLIAVTLAHETTHAMFNALEGTAPEPTVGQSMHSELGNAFEDHLFGGVDMDVKVSDEMVVEMYYKVLEKHGIYCKHLS